MEDKSQIPSKNTNSNSNNVTENDYNEDEPEFLDVVVPNSSSDSQNNGENEDEDEVAQVDDSYEDDDNGDEVAKSSDITNQRSNNAKNDDEEEQKEDATKNESAASYCFPINRISRIIKSEDPDIRIAQEAVFLINKASEKFLELFCKEAYACAFLDRKNHLEYKHLSSVVSKRRRFDFLSDFIPEKLKAKDALAEMSSAET